LFKQSDKINKLASQVDPGEHTDHSCTTSYNNDGSTGEDIFTNGYELAVAAKGRDVYVVYEESDDGDVAYFFIGTEEEIIKKLTEALDDGSFGDDD